MKCNVNESDSIFENTFNGDVKLTVTYLKPSTLSTLSVAAMKRLLVEFVEICKPIIMNVASGINTTGYVSIWYYYKENFQPLKYGGFDVSTV